jgi:proton-translocating NADH-quinone oxidoreductase chain N
MNTILFKTFLPEVFFSISILAQVLFNTNMIVSYKTNFPLINKEIFSQVFFILISIVLIYFNIRIECISYNFFFTNTLNDYFTKICYLFICLIIFVSIWRSFILQKLNFFEFFTILMISIFSLLLLLNSLHLISIYLIIELQALCFYVLSCFTRKSSFSTEAGLKYFISGSFISGFFLFGCSLLYGSLGTLNLNILNLLLNFPLGDDLSLIVLVGILLITVTFLFKISAAPFHFWSPDVYEGSALSSTIVFSIVPKLILFTFLIKWLSSLGSFFFIIRYLLIGTGLFSVFIGTFFAIQQKRVKRIIIYSSIAQIGYIVLALSTNSLEGFSSVYFFLIIYLITSLIIWSFITLFYVFQRKANKFNFDVLMSIYLSNISNFFESNKLWAILLTFIFYSLSGLPPFIGFFSKLFIIYGLVEVGYFFTAILLVLIGIISVFYYVRFIKLLFFEKNNIRVQNIKYQTIFYNDKIEFDIFIIAVGLFLLLWIFFYPNFLLLITQYFVLSNTSI